MSFEVFDAAAEAHGGVGVEELLDDGTGGQPGVDEVGEDQTVLQHFFVHDALQRVCFTMISGGANKTSPCRIIGNNKVLQTVITKLS